MTLPAGKVGKHLRGRGYLASYDLFSSCGECTKRSRVGLDLGCLARGEPGFDRHDHALLNAPVIFFGSLAQLSGQALG